MSESVKKVELRLTTAPKHTNLRLYSRGALNRLDVKNSLSLSTHSSYINNTGLKQIVTGRDNMWTHTERTGQLHRVAQWHNSTPPLMHEAVKKHADKKRLLGALSCLLVVVSSLG